VNEDNLKQVKFISEMPKFLGPELEQYGPFLSEENAKLPKIIAEILVENKKAVYI
jgi:hypothetical protein